VCGWVCGWARPRAYNIRTHKNIILVSGRRRVCTKSKTDLSM